MVEVASAPPTAAQVDQAKADYQRALEVLKADRRAGELREKQRLVGQCFKYIASTDEPPAAWPVYIAAMYIASDDESSRLNGWHFQDTPAGQLEIAVDLDLQPGFLTERCLPVARNEFVAAFNELLTATARFATRMPPI